MQVPVYCWWHFTLAFYAIWTSLPAKLTLWSLADSCPNLTSSSIFETNIAFCHFCISLCFFPSPCLVSFDYCCCGKHSCAQHALLNDCLHMIPEFLHLLSLQLLAFLFATFLSTPPAPNHINVNPSSISSFGGIHFQLFEQTKSFHPNDTWVFYKAPIYDLTHKFFLTIQEHHMGVQMVAQSFGKGRGEGGQCVSYVEGARVGGIFRGKYWKVSVIKTSPPCTIGESLTKFLPALFSSHGPHSHSSDMLPCHLCIATTNTFPLPTTLSLLSFLSHSLNHHAI